MDVVGSWSGIVRSDDNVRKEPLRNRDSQMHFSGTAHRRRDGYLLDKENGESKEDVGILVMFSLRTRFQASQ